MTQSLKSSKEDRYPTVTFCLILESLFLKKSVNLGVALPVTPFLGKQLLELSQRDDPSFDRGPVWDRLATEVIRHSNVLTLLLFHAFVSVEVKIKHLKDHKRIKMA